MSTASEEHGAQAAPAVVLAPMSGVTDVVFRRLAARFGATAVVSEMVAAERYVVGDVEARLRADGEGVSPHVVQVVGRDPAAMAEAARLAEGSGADMIDLNMGCPARKVTGGLAGSALMREPDLALRIVAAVVAAVSLPVTVKMRLGWDGGSLNAAELTGRAADLGVRVVTIHGRTRAQFYTGSADWGAIGSVVERCPVPVLANGDVVDLASARACLARSCAAGVMMGRATLGQPWLVGTVARALAGRDPSPPPPADRTAAAVEHYEGLLTLYGRAMAVRHARKHLAAYADRAAEAGFGLSAADRRDLVLSDDPARVTALLRRLYDDEPMRAAA